LILRAAQHDVGDDELVPDLDEDVIASNSKLKARARQAVELVTEASSDEAHAAPKAVCDDARRSLETR
jgi:N-acetylmuramic acid 6-phosphate (MurNAc-6-P) etherase